MNKEYRSLTLQRKGLYLARFKKLQASFRQTVSHRFGYLSYKLYNWAVSWDNLILRGAILRLVYTLGIIDHSLTLQFCWNKLPKVEVFEKHHPIKEKTKPARRVQQPQSQFRVYHCSEFLLLR